MSEAWKLEEEGLEAGGGVFGWAAVIPWDTEIFGLGAGWLRLEKGWGAERDRGAAGGALERWARERGVEVCGCAVGAGEKEALRLAGELGFRFVECTLKARVSCRRAVGGEGARLERAGSADGEAVRRLARESFRAGRYHADPEFPTALADRRYEVWVERALGGEGELLVMREEGGVAGFMQVEMKGETADLRLAAVDRELWGSGAGAALYRGAVDWARERGAVCAVLKASAANVAVVNLLSGMGFRFGEPEVVLHRHWRG